MTIFLLQIVIFFHASAIAVTEAQDFLLYGYVDVRVDYDNCLCRHQLAVQIGSHIWQQPLNWRSYAFKVRQNSLNSRVGALSLDIYRGEKLVKSLWKEHFVIEPWGVHRLDIHTVDDEQQSCACQPSKTEEYALVKVVSGDMVKFTKSSSYSSNYNFTCPLCHCQCRCHCKGEEEDEIMSQLVMLFPAIDEEGKPEANKHAILLHFLILVFGIAQLMLRLLQSRMGICKLGESSSIMEEGEGRRNWQMSSYSSARRSNSKMGVLVSGEGTYEEAWAWADAADNHLNDVDCCFYFNSTAMNTPQNKFASVASASSEGEGPWNRDSFGRLIRLSTITQ